MNETPTQTLLSQVETFMWKQRLRIESALNPQKAMSYTHARVECVPASGAPTQKWPQALQPWQQTAHATGPRRPIPEMGEDDNR